MTALAPAGLAPVETRRALLLAALLVVVIALGLAADQHFALGQVVTSVAVWLLFLVSLRLADRAGKVLLAACVVFATLGEWFLSLSWGLYDYRLGNLPLFVPPGHALLLMLGMIVAARVGDWIVWSVPLVALPVVLMQAFGGGDTFGALLFGVLLAAMWFGRSRKLYAVMFVLALAMELYGTWLGNWRWRATVPWLGLSTANPPLTAGAFYCVLDVLVMAAARILRIPVTDNREPNQDGVAEFLARILEAKDGSSHVGEIDRVRQLAPGNPADALVIARDISVPWQRAQGLAVVARWIDRDRVEAIAGESIAAAMKAPDDYKRSAAMAWPIAALAERDVHKLAFESLERARRIAATATPNSSRAYSLGLLLRAAWPLGVEVRHSLVVELAGLQRQDSFWRISDVLVHSLRMLDASDGALVRGIIECMSDARWQRKARAALERLGSCGPGSFF